MKLSKKSAEQLLLANLYRSMQLAEIMPALHLDIENTKLVSNFAHDNRGALLLFSGAFVAPRSTVILPFSLTFNNREELATGPTQLATICKSKRGQNQIFSFLALIEYLIQIGKINTPLAKFVERITRGCTNTVRLNVCDQYPAFRQKSFDLLPYDAYQELKWAELSDIRAAA
ncbi:hypothetical protein [Paraburkholderia fungorum]|uniref:Uncharacterized protein n=1 Tax=Paraburkholderia fungorum TaxID=134537 RepID=A0AAW3V232_9BURK|nr:hypothetical protein [Paraburkholderia fungorum]MBB4515847.1 hypothetical protein [Paraburkholderia fungorum]MBB6203737.1 hypothetical protein [Paraburkholderia fungorum]